MSMRVVRIEELASTPAKGGKPAHQGILPISAATVWRWVRDNPDFSKPFKLGPSVTAWLTPLLAGLGGTPGLLDPVAPLEAYAARNAIRRREMMMGFRFRKTVKLFSGVKLNLSRSGVSTSLGVPGATVNLKEGRKSRAPVGLSGTGVSYSENVEHDASPGGTSLWMWLLIIIAMVVVYRLFG